MLLKQASFSVAGSVQPLLRSRAYLRDEVSRYRRPTSCGAGDRHRVGERDLGAKQEFVEQELIRLDSLDFEVASAKGDISSI